MAGLWELGPSEECGNELMLVLGELYRRAEKMAGIRVK